MAKRRRKRAPKRGKAKIKSKNKAKSSKSESSRTGLLKMHREGTFGFLLPDDSDLEDIFIPGRRLGGALDGDHVRVSYWKERGGNRLEGAVEEVLARGKKWFVGTLEKSKSGFRVDCPMGRQHLIFQVDREELKGGKLGETVGIEVLEYPSNRQEGRAKVIQWFGARGDEKTEIDIVILKHQLPTDFPKEVLKEANELKRLPLPKVKGSRRDLRKLELVTIDGETARDFDDAICVRQEGKNFRLWVAIADVSHYVQEGSELDREALARGTSVYFTQKVLPMLPEVLSNDLCSLRPGEDRAAMTAEILFDQSGKVKETDFYPCLIRSQARLTYRQVARAIVDEDPKAQEKISSSIPMLRQAFALFKTLRRKRLERGSIDFDLPEPEFILDLEEGNVENIVRSERNEAHMLIEEFMVAANEAVARYVTGRKRPMIYRTHGEPDPEKILNFQTLLHNLGFQVRLPKKPTPKDMGKVLKAASGHAEEKLVQHFLLRSMKQAIYSTKNEGHYGLASECYAHFTSPIRRYPDLTLHRSLKKLWKKPETPAAALKKDRAQLKATAMHASRRERISMEAEWEALDLTTALFMKQFLGKSFNGHVARITKFGFFVELQEYFVEGLVLLEDLKDERYFFDEKHHRLTASRGRKVIKIGTPIQVQVAKVDIEERRVYFLPEARPTGGSGV